MIRLLTRSVHPAIPAVVLVAGLALTACARPPSVGAPMPLTPISRYTLQVEPGVDRIALAVHETGLSATQRAALNDLAGRFSVSGAAYLRVEAPSGDDQLAAAAAWGIQRALEQTGIPGNRIQVAAYNAPDPRAPVLVGFETRRAYVPFCADEPRDMGPRPSNQSSIGLGCAITANMAAQIADPNDIVGARAMTPADSGRAAVVFDNYRKGQPASTPQETLVNGRISNAVD